MAEHSFLILIAIAVIGLCAWRLLRHKPYQQSLKALPIKAKRNTPVAIAAGRALLHRGRRAAGKSIRRGASRLIGKIDQKGTAWIQKRARRKPHVTEKTGVLIQVNKIKTQPTGRSVCRVSLAGEDTILYAKRHPNGMVFPLPNGAKLNQTKTLAVWRGYSFGFLETSPKGKNWFQINIKGWAFVFIYPTDCDVEEARAAWVKIKSVVQSENSGGK